MKNIDWNLVMPPQKQWPTTPPGENEQIVCIQEDQPSLTLNVVYWGHFFTNGYCSVITNDGTENLYQSTCFMRLSEFRNSRLDQLGI